LDIRETRKVESIHEYYFVEWKKEGRKPGKNLSLRRLKFYAQKPQLKMPFENSISGYAAERANADNRSSVDMWSMGPTVE
jgi:hypothetical protein